MAFRFPPVLKGMRAIDGSNQNDTVTTDSLRWQTSSIEEKPDYCIAVTEPKAAAFIEIFFLRSSLLCVLPSKAMMHQSRIGTLINSICWWLISGGGGGKYLYRSHCNAAKVYLKTLSAVSLFVFYSYFNYLSQYLSAKQKLHLQHISLWVLFPQDNMGNSSHTPTLSFVMHSFCLLTAPFCHSPSIALSSLGSLDPSI